MSDGVGEDLFVPDRFEQLAELADKLPAIVEPVEESLALVTARLRDLRGARRGGLLVLRGETGAGKSTFLDTFRLFREGVTTIRVAQGDDVGEALRALHPAEHARLVVLEGREALGTVSSASLEADLHAINAFVRTTAGEGTLIVWPTNTDRLTSLLIDLANELGGTALLGVGDPLLHFSGPDPAEYPQIADRTIAAVNEGATLVALGVDESRAAALAEDAATIGDYLSLVRGELLQNGARVRELLAAERFRLWTVVIAGNDVEGDVAALTRGSYATADIDRLLVSTGANVVKELEKSPDVVGILGTVLDARILHLDMVTVLSLARQFGDSRLHDQMKAEGLTVTGEKGAVERLRDSELGVIAAGESLGTRRRGPKAGSNTAQAFSGLAAIARTNDTSCNRAIAEGLKASGLIADYVLEKDFGHGLTRRTDIYAETERFGPVRIEVVWRTETGRAGISNYVLTKLDNYAKAIGLL